MKKLLSLVLINLFFLTAYCQVGETPKPVAPYSQSRMTSAGILFISGQIPLDPATDQLLKGDIRRETEQVMKNIVAILKTNNMDLTNVVKCTVFLTDMDDFKDMNEVYAGFFPDKVFPAREAIEVVKLPLGANIEISAVASR